MNDANQGIAAANGGGAARQPTVQKAKKLEIYCILCPSYHGATLLSLLLGNHTKVFSLGDTIPTEPFPIRCGCGAPFDRCEF